MDALPTYSDSPSSYQHTPQERSDSSSPGNKRYPCPVCTARFDRPSSLVQHMRVHTGEKPFVCDRCHKAFSAQSNMRRHRKACPIEPTRPPGQAVKYLRSESEGYFHNDGGESDDAAYFSDAASLSPSLSMAGASNATGVSSFWAPQHHISPPPHPDATSPLPPAAHTTYGRVTGHAPAQMNQEAMHLHLPPPRHASIPPPRYPTQQWTTQTQHYIGHGLQYPPQVPYPVSALHTTNSEDENPRHEPGTAAGAQAYYYSATGWNSEGL